MGDAKLLLKKWALDFVRNRDAFFRKIAKIDEGKTDFTIIYKDGREQTYMAIPSLENAQESLSSFTSEQHVVIITLNNKQNRQKLSELWKILSAYKLLTMYFVNPLSQGEKKWVLMPHVHDKVCDASSLAAGFNSLSELVEDISEEDANAKAV